jgi:hypothetical protein
LIQIILSQDRILKLPGRNEGGKVGGIGAVLVRAYGLRMRDGKM